MSTAELAAFIEEQRRRYAQGRTARARLDQNTLEQEIEPALGSVVVDPWGTLLVVRLDRERLRVTDPRSLDQRVLRAIHAAEARAERTTEEYLRAGGTRD